MSEAPALIALFTTRSTRSMIGAASLRSLSPAIGSPLSSSGRRINPSPPGPRSSRCPRVASTLPVAGVVFINALSG
jgi:hypothetical protein